MNISVGQIYVEAGVSLPFSHLMQIWLGQQLSTLVLLTPDFAKVHGTDFALVIRISARKGLKENDVKGPTVFKRTKDVEYTLFLPYDTIVKCSDGRRIATEFILDGVEAIVAMAKLDPGDLSARRVAIRDHLCTDPSMLKSQWPFAPT
jgi:hypothetical protein